MFDSVIESLGSLLETVKDIPNSKIATTALAVVAILAGVSEL